MAEENEIEKTATQKNKKPIIIAAVCVVAVALIACAVFLFMKNEQDHTPVPVSFSFELPNYDSQTGSGVPLLIEGKDLDGNNVSELVLADEGNTDVELLRGEYDISVFGSPVNGSGGIYSIPETVVNLEINENSVVINGEPATSVEGDDSSIEIPAFAFIAVKPQNVTDKQIEAVKYWMIEVGFSEETISNFSDLIAENRKAGIKQAEADALAAWRTKLTGTFGGTGQYAPSEHSIWVSVDGDKLTVKGNLQKITGGSYSSSMGSGEWHFILTSQTSFTETEEFSRTVSRSTFLNHVVPNGFVGLDIKVRDGYVVNMDTHA